MIITMIPNHYRYFFTSNRKRIINFTFSNIKSNAEAHSYPKICDAVKTSINDYEGKYDSKINNIQVISSLENIDNLIPEFKKIYPQLVLNYLIH